MPKVPMMPRTLSSESSGSAGDLTTSTCRGALARSSGGRVSSGGGVTGGRRSEILADFVHGVGGVVEGGALGQMEGFEFGVDVGPIVGELVHDLGKLLADGPAHGADDYKG